MNLKPGFLLLLLFLIPMQIHSQCTRQQVIDDYNNIYLQSAVSNTQLGWTGNTSTCLAGTISDLAQTNTLARINYYRKLAGLSSMVTFDPTNDSKCQQAALMMAANNSLSHNPPASWLCYTSDGAQAAMSSNLYLGGHTASAVDAYMNDNGITFAGHRRWILNSRPPAFGHGSTINSDALWVVGFSGTGSATPVTFPSEGYFPAPLVPASKYWSFGLYNAGFSSATVQMLDQSGSDVTINLFAVVNGYGDNTIVWQAPDVLTNSPYDVKYTVKVNNVLVDGVYKNFSYDVIICQTVHPPQCPDSQTWSETDCACSTLTGINSSNMPRVRISTNNPFSDILQVKVQSINNGRLKLAVVDITGKEMEHRDLSISAGEFLTFYWDTTSWIKGVYFIVLEDQDKVKTVLKVIKQ